MATRDASPRITLNGYYGAGIGKWDRRFLELSRTVASWSKDPSTQTGAVIVRPDNTVVSLGYNGFPAGMNDDPALYEDREKKYSRIIHCEMNALITAKQDVTGCTLYTYPFLSCDRCAAHMVQAGIVRAVAPRLPAYLRDRWLDSITKSHAYYKEAGVDSIEFEFDFEERPRLP